MAEKLPQRTTSGPQGVMTPLDPNMAQGMMIQGQSAYPRTGFINRLVNGVRYVVADVAPDTWFGPGQPTFPVTNDESARGRRFDYQVGVNIQLQPRIETGISFAELRAMADAHDITRACIETRKDQVVRTPWEIRMKDKKAKPNEKAIEQARNLMLRPDGVKPFITYVREVIEEVIVIDALTAEPRLNGKGELCRIDLISGSTIKPVLDADGRIPLPPDPAYQQVLHGVPTANFSTDQLVYFMRNPRVHKIYGFSVVEQTILRVNTALRRDIKTLQYYTDGNVPAGIYLAPPDWKADQIAELSSYFDSKLAGNTAAQNKVIFLAGGTGTQFIETRKVDLKDGFDEWLARVTCFLHSIPPTALVNQTNRATAQQQGDTALEEGLLPMLTFLESFFNTILQGPGGWPELELVFQKEGTVDSLSAAKTDDVNIKNGSKSIDEIRTARGDEPIGIGHGVITATGWIALPTKENIAAGLAKDPLAEPEPDPNPPIHHIGADGKPLLGPDGKPVPLTESKPGTPKAEPTPEPKPEPAPKDNKVEKKKTIKVKFQPDSYPHEAAAAFKATLAHFFGAQAKRNAKRMSRVYEEVTKAVGDDSVDRIMAELDLDAFTFLLDPAIKYLTESAQHVGHKAVMDVQGFVPNDQHSDLWGMVNDDAAAYGKLRGAQMVGKKWVDGELVDNPNAKWAITDSTSDYLRTLTQEAIDSGWTAGEYKKAILDNTAFSESRAKGIARFEMSKAAGQGQRAAWKNTGLDVKKQNVLSSGHSVEDVCDECTAEGLIPFDQAFASGELESPHHPGGCACDIEYIASMPGTDTEE